VNVKYRIINEWQMRPHSSPIGLARLKMGLEIAAEAWDNPRMKVSSDDRCRLQSRDLFKPNTPYEGGFDAMGRIVLTELVRKSGPARFRTKAEVVRAIDKSPLRFKRTWEQMRGDLREP
jgi:hypothetical protein